MDCSGCHRSIRFWEATYPGKDTWHFSCWVSWEEGYKTAAKYADDMCKRAGAPTPAEIYWLTNPYNNAYQYTDIRKGLMKKYKQGRRKQFKLNI